MPTLNELVWNAREAARLWSDGKLAEFLGCSRRTIQRHVGSAGLRCADDYHALIRAAHPNNREVAAQLAAARGTSLAALGLENPQEPQAGAPPAATAGPIRREHADSVVSAAADVLKLHPAAVWPAIAAAFARAKEMNAPLDALAAFLSKGKAPGNASGKRG